MLRCSTCADMQRGEPVLTCSTCADVQRGKWFPHLAGETQPCRHEELTSCRGSGARRICKRRREDERLPQEAEGCLDGHVYTGFVDSGVFSFLLLVSRPLH